MKTKTMLKNTSRILPVFALALAVAITVALGAGETVQWDVVDGGGGLSAGGGNTLWSSTVQDSTYVVATGAANTEYQGYIIPLPDDASVYCQNGGVACAGAPTYYGTGSQTFTFINNACGTAPGTPCAFDRRATSYYRYLWQQSATCDSAALNTASTWSDQNYFCPGGTCTKLGTSMALNATLDGDWYLCARSYNGGIIGTTQVLGPYQYDAAGPTITNLDANNIDYINLYVDGTFDLSADVEDLVSKLKDGTCEYQCSGGAGLCDGTWRAGTDDWSGTATTNGVCSASNVTCTTNGAGLTISMRVKDNADNSTTSTSISRTCDIQQPTCSVSALSEAGLNTYYAGAGTTVYYCNTASCGTTGGFSATVTATDALSGVQKVNFPSPGGLTGCGDDASNPYSCAFTFDGSTTHNGAVTQTSYDNVNNTNTCGLTLTLDTTPPAGGSIAYADGWYTGTTIAITMTNGTDGGAGIYQRILQRQSAAIAAGACGAFGAWGDVATDPALSYNDTGVAGNCYKYRYVEYDRVNNSTTYTSANIVKISDNPTVTGLDANNTDYNDLYVDGTFDLSANVQDLYSMLKDNSCEYRCVGAGGLCDGTWRAAADNWSGTGTSSGVCSASNVTCTVNGDALAIYMRVQDNASNLTTSAAINRTCDTLQPTCSVSALSEAANNIYYPGAGTTIYYCNTASCGTTGNFSATVAATDAGSGMQKVNFPSPNSLTGCGDDASSPYTCSFSFGAATTQNGAVTQTSYDNVNNTNTCDFTLTLDTTAPAGGGISYADGWYTGGTVAITLTNGTDAGAGINARYLQRQSATLTNGVCGAYGGWSSIATNPASPYDDSPTAGNCYKYRYREQDRVNNNRYYTSASIAIISGGAYLNISQIDADASDNPEGILTPDNTDYERVDIKLLNENDQVITSGSISTKTVIVTLGNLGLTGAYISETNLTGAVVGPGIFVATGNLVNGEAYVKIKSLGIEDPDAITVTPTAIGLSAYGGHDQVVYLLVRDDSNLAWPIDTNSNLADAVAGDLIVNPVWSHSGDKIVYISHDAGIWNIYKKTYSGSWSSPIRLTNANMMLRPGANITWSGDDQYIIFSAKDDIAGGNNEPELYAVLTSDNGSVGDDAGKTLTNLRTANQRLTDLAFSATNFRRWADSDWSRTSCSNGFSDDIVSSMAVTNATGNKGAELFVVNGTKEANGLYRETGSATITQLTDISGLVGLFQPRWSNDCSKIVFVVLDGVGTQSRTSIYIMNITDSGWGARVNGGALPATPITSLSASGMFKIHECTPTTCTEFPAIYPTFSADDTFLLYATDKTSSFDIRGLQQDDIKGQFYTGKNFNNYAVYIQDHSYVKQEVGQSANNEFALSQCGGGSCPDSAQGKPIVYITQSAATKGDLRILYLDTESTVTANGGLLFMNGGVAAVIKPGALQAETILEVSDPAGAPGTPDGTALLVSTGISRDFFPDGVIFSEDVLLVFHYCDTDGDGFLDNRQTSDCSGATGGSSGLDENKIFVYYWCDAGTGGTRNCTDATWQKLNGSIDPSNNMVTVATNHFSTYDVKALLRGLAAPQVVRELYLSNPHTFPNPWRAADGLLYFNIDGDSSFNTQAEGAAGMLTVNINVYDIRGQLVRTINNTVTGLATLAGSVDGTRSSSGRGLDLASWNATNNAGSPLASGVYLYHMTVSDGIFTRDVTGKLAITR